MTGEERSVSTRHMQRVVRLARRVMGMRGRSASRDRSVSISSTASSIRSREPSHDSSLLSTTEPSSSGVSFCSTDTSHLSTGHESRRSLFERRRASSLSSCRSAPSISNTSLIHTAEPESFGKDFPPGAIVVYTDGSCIDKSASGVGIFFGKGHPLNKSEALPAPHNSGLAEIRAAQMALTSLQHWKQYNHQPVIMRTDYLPLIQAMNLGNNGRFADEYDKLRALAASFPNGVLFEHVYGHNGDPGNEEADRLAGLATAPAKRARSRARSEPRSNRDRARSRSRSRSRGGERRASSVPAKNRSAFVPGKKSGEREELSMRSMRARSKSAWSRREEKRERKRERKQARAAAPSPSRSPSVTRNITRSKSRSTRSPSFFGTSSGRSSGYSRASSLSSIGARSTRSVSASSRVSSGYGGSRRK